MSIPRREIFEDAGWTDGRLGQAHDLVTAVKNDYGDQPLIRRLLGDLMDAVETADVELGE